MSTYAVSNQGQEDTKSQSEALESQVNKLAQDLIKENFVKSTASAGEAEKRPLTKAEKSEAMQHMSSSAREKLHPKSGQQKFLEKYNLTSNKDPILKKTLLRTEE